MKYTSLKIDASLLFIDKPEIINTEISSFITDLAIPPTNIAKIDCYVSISNQDEYLTCQTAFTSALNLLFGKKLPANTLIDLKPTEAANKALIRLSIVDSNKATVECKEFQKHAYSLVTVGDEKILFSGNIGFPKSGDLLRNIQSTYDFAEQLLDHEEMHFGHIALLNDYIEHLNEDAPSASTGWSNVETLEEVRSLYFDPVLFKHGSPLQLINNIQHGEFHLDFIAATKDGFPTAQCFKSDNASEGSTQYCYIPGLRKIFSGNLNDGSGTTIEKQLQLVTNRVKNIMNTCCVEANKTIDELKITLPDTNQSTILQNEMANLLTANKIYFFEAPLKDSQLFFDLEVIASVSY